MTPEVFLSRVRSKNPQWDAVDDSTLFYDLLEKYPYYRDRIQYNPMMIY